MTLGDGAATEPNAKATIVEARDGLAVRSQNAWPSLAHRFRRDQQPASRRSSPPASTTRPSWARSAAPGCSTSPSSAAPPGSARRASSPTPTATRPRTPSATCWSSAAGRPGLSAALAAGRAGARVILCDDSPVLGGALDLEDRIGERRSGRLAVRDDLGAERAAECPRADAHQRLRLLRRQRARRGRARSPPAAASAARAAALAHRRRGASCSRPARSSGPSSFPATTRPASCWRARRSPMRAATAWRSAREVVVFTNNDGGWQRAAALSRAGVPVRAVVDPRARGAGRVAGAARRGRHGVPDRPRRHRGDAAARR